MPFTKLDSNFASSSIFAHGLEVVGFWSYLLSQADGQGRVRATIPDMAARCRTTEDRVMSMLSILEAPDPWSRTPGNEGRRVRIECEPEWCVWLLNHSKYRERDETAAQRAKRYRERHGASRVTGRNVTHTEAEAEADVTDSPKVGRESVSYLPPPTERAERAVNDTVRSLHLRLGEMLCRLAEHPNSRRMVHDWSRAVTSYERPDGTKVKGVPDWRTIQSIDRLERSISDAEWWLAELEKGAEGGTL